MKCYRLTLSIGLHVFVVADRVHEVDGQLQFHRGESLVGSYPKVSVVRLLEVDLPEGGGADGDADGSAGSGTDA